jgi:hypothetical protein
LLFYEELDGLRVMTAGTLATAYGGNETSFPSDKSAAFRSSATDRPLFLFSCVLCLEVFCLNSTALHMPIQKFAGAVTGNPASAASASAMSQQMANLKMEYFQPPLFRQRTQHPEPVL